MASGIASIAREMYSRAASKAVAAFARKPRGAVPVDREEGRHEALDRMATLAMLIFRQTHASLAAFSD